jgi:hypothetical protein
MKKAPKRIKRFPTFSHEFRALLNRLEQSPNEPNGLYTQRFFGTPDTAEHWRDTFYAWRGALLEHEKQIAKRISISLIPPNPPLGASLQIHLITPGATRQPRTAIPFTIKE